MESCIASELFGPEVELTTSISTTTSEIMGLDSSFCQKNPCLKLLAAMLERTAEDLMGRGSSHCGIRGEMETRELIRKARHFVLNKDNAPFSFVWICEHLDMDAELLEREMLKRCAHAN